MAVTVTLDTSVLDDLMAHAAERADEVCGQLADDLARDIKSNWSASSPSAAGSPPGVDTGALNESVEARQEKPMQWGVWGNDYGLLLESGTRKMAARPFIYAAAMRIAEKFADAFVVVVKR